MKKIIQTKRTALIVTLLLIAVFFMGFKTNAKESPTLKDYDNSTAATSLQFTTAEKEYIKNSPVLLVGLNADRAPFSKYDEKTDTFSGICVDILEHISQKSGLRFQYEPMAKGKTTPELMEEEKFDFICGIERDNFITNETIISTDAFLESSIVPVGRQGVVLDINSNLKAAIPSSFQALKKALESKYPNLELNFYNTNRECLNAVVDGEADVFIQNTHILSQLLQEPKYEKLKILPVNIMTEHTAIALPRNAQPELLSVLNKSINNIDQAEISKSLIEHTFANPYQYTALDFLYKLRIQIIIIGTLVAICFILLCRVAVVRKSNEIKLQKKNELLAVAVAQADRANVAKSQFLSRMSHEIRTPMNAIAGLTQIARQHINEAEKVDDYLNKIDFSSKVLLDIINDVLDMSAIESNKIKISNDEFNMKQVLEGITTIYYPQCQNKGIKFEMATDLPHEKLLGDSLRVNQILLNLVSNAYKFTEKNGEIYIFVKETGVKDKTAFIRFEVSDTGCGMSEEMKERLFKPFEQETAQTAQKHGGSGLGLSIAKNLIDMMHGAIAVDSEKGKGTKFIVDLPFEIVDNEEFEKIEVSQYDFTGHKILLAEDQELNAEIAIELLSQVNMETDRAENGQQAVEIFSGEKQGTYDMILMDVQMPILDGYEATRAIRNLPNCEDATTIPIIAMTANAYTEDISKALSAGMNGHIAKPIDTEILYSTIYKAIHHLL